jgi:hypothetical protein
MRLRSQKRRRKAFKQTTRHINKKVLNVKPYPVPDLEGQPARVFEEKIREPASPAQKRIMKEASIVFSQTKRRE